MPCDRTAPAAAVAGGRHISATQRLHQVEDQRLLCCDTHLYEAFHVLQAHVSLNNNYEYDCIASVGMTVGDVLQR